MIRTHYGKLIMDATVAPQGVRYPTDLGVLDEARERTETMIDMLHAQRFLEAAKPRIYRRQARRRCVAGIRSQLQHVRRNLGYIENLLNELMTDDRQFPLSAKWQRRYFIVQQVYAQ